jgi:Leucine-rich repeat (LRR) protein
LDCSDNQLTTLSVTNKTQLTSLNCDVNMITNFRVINLNSVS